MDQSVYETEARIEEHHWWFRGRRLLFSRLLSKLNLPSNAKILDVGSSTGANLRMLIALGYEDVLGLDVSDESVRFCAEKGLGSVQRGDVSDMPFENGCFDLVLATDIIEHVDEDVRALREILRVLKPGGHALITVPAFTSLWGVQDTVAHHRRRYRRGQLLEAIQGAGLLVDRCFYFNYLLFFPIWLARTMIGRLSLPVKNENDVNGRALNALLHWVFVLDVRTAPWLGVPFGVSIAAVVRKRSADEER